MKAARLRRRKIPAQTGLGIFSREAVWEKDGGPIKLLVESGLDSNKVPVGIPYGAIARMILLYLQTQAVKTRRREVELGSSMNAWLTTMRVPIGGRAARGSLALPHGD